MYSIIVHVRAFSCPRIAFVAVACLATSGEGAFGITLRTPPLHDQRIGPFPSEGVPALDPSWNICTHRLRAITHLCTLHARYTLEPGKEYLTDGTHCAQDRLHFNGQKKQDSRGRSSGPRMPSLSSKLFDPSGSPLRLRPTIQPWLPVSEPYLCLLLILLISTDACAGRYTSVAE